MADPPPYPDSSGDTGDESDRESTTGTPRWVKVFGIIALVVVLAFVIVLVTQGPHRPGMHGGGGGEAPASSIVALSGVGGHDPSDWGH
jgi:hypothetical protein